jgi:hypothetical protein
LYHCNMYWITWLYLYIEFSNPELNHQVTWN